MPIKQVVCSVCKETVNKAVTYHVGGTDRACRSHEGVAEKKAQLDAQKQKAQAMSVQKAEHRRPSGDGYGGHGDWSVENALKPKCWVCMNTGLRSQDFMMRYLIEVEKQSKITGKTIIPLFETTLKLKERCIFVLPKDKCEAALKYVREDFRMLVNMGGGYLAICGDCCHLNKIDPFPKVEWEDMKKFMLLSEIVIRPVVEAQAAMELARDN